MKKINIKTIIFILLAQFYWNISFSQIRNEINITVLNNNLYFGKIEKNDNYFEDFKNEIVFKVKNLTDRSFILFFDETNVSFANSQNKLENYTIIANIKDSTGYDLIPASGFLQLDNDADHQSGLLYTPNKIKGEYFLRNIKKDEEWFEERRRIEDSCIFLDSYDSTLVFVSLSLPTKEGIFLDSFDKLFCDPSNSLDSLKKYSIVFKLECNPEKVFPYLYDSELNALKKRKIEFYNGILETYPVPLLYFKSK